MKTLARVQVDDEHQTLDRDGLLAMMRREPTLNNFGFGVHYTEDWLPEASKAFIMKREAAKLLESLDRVQVAGTWIRAHLRPSPRINRHRSSYFLKHVAERDTGYLANGVFIAAMIACGYRYQIVGPNARFNVDEPTVRAIVKTRAPWELV